MIAQMKKIVVSGPKSLTQAVIDLLQELGTVHLTESEKTEKKRLDEKLGHELSAQEKLLAKLETLTSLLPVSQKISHSTLDSEIKDWESWSNDLSQKVYDLGQKKQTLSDELSIIRAYQETLKTLAPLLEPLSGSKNFETLGFIVSKRESKRLEEMEQELAKLFAGKVLLFKRSTDSDSLGLVIAFYKSQSSQLRSFLNRYGLSEIKLPSSLASYSFSDAVKQMEIRHQEIPNLLKEVEKNLQEISDKNLSSLQSFKFRIQDRINALKANRGLGQTQKTFVLTGFNPEKDIKSLETALQKHFGSSVYLGVEDCHHAPTLLQNKRWARPFELFIKVLRPPKYGSIDPTPFVAIFFPIFFGLIMGDIGYGAIFFVIALILRFKTKNEMIKSVSEIILMASTYTIIFGFVFGECFGDWLERKGVLHPLTMHLGGTTIEWNRMHSLVPLLLLAIGIGVMHVTLGFVLKLIQSIRHRHNHETIEVIAILVALASLFALIGVLAGQIPNVIKIPSVIAIVISIPLLIIMKGPMMLMELLSFVGNMLSYARLMAVGVASAYLAFVGNMMGSLVGNVILGAIIAITFHIINMILAFSPTIQSVRLHYVEFFTKFYEAGGDFYQPLTKSGKR